MEGFKKYVSPSVSESLLIHFNSSQNVFPILLRNVLAIVEDR